MSAHLGLRHGYPITSIGRSKKINLLETSDFLREKVKLGKF